MEDLPGSSLRATVVHKKLKILPRVVNLCQEPWLLLVSKECGFNDRARECGVARFTAQFFLFWTS